MTTKEIYNRFCEANPRMSVFLQPWWLDAVYSEGWEVLLYEEGEQVLAAMPYCRHRKYGFTAILQPKLTPVTGMWIAYPEDCKRSKRYALEIKAMEYFAEQIDDMKPAYYQTMLHFSLTSWLGFFWHGYKQTTRYTYRFTHLEDLDYVFSQCSTEVRKCIRKLEKQDFTVRNDLPLKQFYEINTLTYARQGVKCPFSFEDFERIEAAAAARNQSRRYAICDKEGRVHSVTYVICSGDVWHSIFAGSDPELRSSNAATLLLWHILEDASAAGCREYNFNGSMMRPIETFIRHFGAEQTPYMMIEKHYSGLYTFLKSLKK